MQGLLENVIGPVGLILAGIGIVLLVGLWVTKDKEPALSDGKVAPPSAEDAEKPASPPVGEGPVQLPPAEEPPVEQPPAEEEPADEQPEPVQQQPPSTPVGDPVIRAHRAMINRAGGASGMTVVAYYLDGLTNSEAIQPVEMKVPTEIGRIAATVEHLIHAPTDLNLHAPFPAGTTVVGANLKQGVAIVDLSAEAAAVRGSAASTAMQHLLVYTLTEIDGVNAVELRIDGRPAQLDQILWDKPVSRADLGVYPVAPLIRYEGP